MHSEAVALEPRNPDTHTTYGEALTAWGRSRRRGAEVINRPSGRASAWSVQDKTELRSPLLPSTKGR